MPPSPLIDRVTGTLHAWPDLRLAIVFGSGAAGTEQPHSGVDVVVQANAPLTLDERLRLVASLADATGRAVDLVNLSRGGEPLIGQVLRGGVRVCGKPAMHAQVLSRHLLDVADFAPLTERKLELQVGGAGAAAHAAQMLAKPCRECRRHEHMLLPRADRRKHLADHGYVIAGQVGFPGQEGDAVLGGFGQWQTDVLGVT